MKKKSRSNRETSNDLKKRLRVNTDVANLCVGVREDVFAIHDLAK